MEYKELLRKFPPSEGCSCRICRSFCMRPGWWSVEQARLAIRQGMAERMMMEVSPERDFAVLSPAFRGNAGKIALNMYAASGCCFLQNGICQLHDTPYYPLECAFCHHDRPGEGEKCHLALEQDWHSARGLALVRRWCELLRYREGIAWTERFYEKQNWREY